MALSQVQCLDDNHVNPRTLETKAEFLYCENQRLALEALLRDGRDAFAKVLLDRELRGFLSDLELEALVGAADTFDPGSELLPADREDGEPPLSLQYWPEMSDTSIPEMDLGWPDCESYRGVTRTTVHTQPPLEGHVHIKEVFRKTIAQAQKVIAVVMDVFTDVDIFRDLLDAGFKRRVAVYILLERTKLPHFLSMCQRANMHSGHLKHLRVRCSEGSEFCARSCKRVKGQLGHRFMFVDGDKAVSGSYSFTWTSSRLDRNLITVVTGQAVNTFDHLFRFLYLTSSFVDLRQIATEPEPVAEPIRQPTPVAVPSAADARKLYSPKYAMLSFGNPNLSPSPTQKEPEKTPELPGTKKGKQRIKPQHEDPPIHPGLLNLEKAFLIPYLPTWPEPDPPSDVIGFINIRDVSKPTQVHMQRSEMFETSQAIRFRGPVNMPQEILPEVARPRQLTLKPEETQGSEAKPEEPAEEPFKEPTEEPTKEPAPEPAQGTAMKSAQGTAQDSGQKAAQVPAQESIQKPPQESTPKPAKVSTQKPAQESNQKPPQESTPKPAQVSTQKPAQESTQKPPQESTLKPAQESAQKPARIPAEESTPKPAQVSAQKPAQIPAQESTPKPAQVSTQKPAQESAQKPAQIPAQESTPKPAQVSTQKPAQESTQKAAQIPAQVSTQKPAQVSTQKPAQVSTQKPAQVSTQKPEQVSSQKPAQKSAQKPAQESAQKPAQESTQKPPQESSQKPEQESAQTLAQVSTQDLTREPTKVSTQKPVQESIKKSTQEHTQNPAQGSAKGSAEKPTVEPVKKLVEEPPKEAAKETTEEPAKEPPKKLSKEPIQVPTQAPTQAPIPVPIQVSTETPFQKPADEPVKELTEKQAELPAEEKVEEPAEECVVERVQATQVSSEPGDTEPEVISSPQNFLKDTNQSTENKLNSISSNNPGSAHNTTPPLSSPSQSSSNKSTSYTNRTSHRIQISSTGSHHESLSLTGSEEEAEPSLDTQSSAEATANSINQSSQAISDSEQHTESKSDTQLESHNSSETTPNVQSHISTSTPSSAPLSRSISDDSVSSTTSSSSSSAAPSPPLSTIPPVPKPRTVQLVIRRQVGTSPVLDKNEPSVGNVVETPPPEMEAEPLIESGSKTEAETAGNLEEVPPQEENVTSQEATGDAVAKQSVASQTTVKPQPQSDVLTSEAAKTQSEKAEELNSKEPESLIETEPTILPKTERNSEVLEQTCPNVNPETPATDSVKGPDDKGEKVLQSKTYLARAHEPQRISYSELIAPVVETRTLSDSATTNAPKDGMQGNPSVVKGNASVVHGNPSPVAPYQTHNVRKKSAPSSITTQEPQWVAPHTPERPQFLRLSAASPSAERKLVSSPKRTLTPDGFSPRASTPDSRTQTPDPRPNTPGLRTSTPDVSDGYMSPWDDLSSPSDEYYECSGSPLQDLVFDRAVSPTADFEGFANMPKYTNNTTRGSTQSPTRTLFDGEQSVEDEVARRPQSPGDTRRQMPLHSPTSPPRWRLQGGDASSPSANKPPRSPPPAVGALSPQAQRKRKSDVPQSLLSRSPPPETRTKSPIQNPSPKARASSVPLTRSKTLPHPHAQEELVREAHKQEQEEEGRAPFNFTFRKLYNLKGLNDKMSKLLVHSKGGGSSSGRKSTY